MFTSMMTQLSKQYFYLGNQIFTFWNFKILENLVMMKE